MKFTQNHSNAFQEQSLVECFIMRKVLIDLILYVTDVICFTSTYHTNAQRERYASFLFRLCHQRG